MFEGFKSFILVTPWPRVETLTPWKQKQVCLKAVDWTPSPGVGLIFLGQGRVKGRSVLCEGSQGSTCASPVVLSYPELEVLQEASLILQDQESSQGPLISLHHTGRELTCSSPLNAKWLQLCLTL